MTSENYNVKQPAHILRQAQYYARRAPAELQKLRPARAGRWKKSTPPAPRRPAVVRRRQISVLWTVRDTHWC
ncbi:hypothetical protein EVAR_41101_1 [Eumeta japonica]|uniref:Uncharacterized protein n=1 Tax=Eumeta variegata TaxID=151549 RepID=A0A4C1XCT5_EUMVA|nr:hypothetical protein EVAR_41101_1 [Eumeta japonica]